MSRVWGLGFLGFPGFGVSRVLGFQGLGFLGFLGFRVWLLGVWGG